jgi:hypothetical protein
MVGVRQRVGRVRTTLERIASVRASGDRRGALLPGLAVAIFAVTLWFAIENLPPLPPKTRWPLLLLIAIPGVPAAIAMNVAEYVVSARILGHHVPLWDGVRTSVVATAANNLPLPGSALVRTRALTEMGSPVKRAALSTAIVGLFWIGVACSLAGLLQTRSTFPPSRWTFVVIGLSCLVLGRLMLAIPQSRSRANALTAVLLAVELGSVGVTALRYHVALLALGLSPSLGQSFTLAVSVVVASAVGIFPGGFGLREVVAGALAPLVKLSSAVGILSVAIDRLIALAFFVPFSVGLFFANTISMRRAGRMPPPADQRTDDR